MTKNIKKIYFNGTNEIEIKEEKQKYAALFNAGTLNEYKKDGNLKKFNAIIFKNNKDYIIVDTDDLNSYKFVMKLIRKYDLYNIIDNFMTLSISNVKDINKNKCHFYFKNNLNLESNKIKINSSNLDILVNSLVFESDSYSRILNSKLLPEMSEQMYKELLNFNTSSNEIKKEIQEPIKEPIKINADNKINDILKCLSIDRFKNYDNWWVIGAILKEINKNNFDIFNEYSKNCGYKKYDYNDVLSFWNNHKVNNSNNKKSIYSLYSLAKEDNPTKYKEFINKYYKCNNDFLENILNTVYSDAFIKLKDLINIDCNISKNIINKSICHYLLFELGTPRLETVDYAIIFNILYKSHFIYNNNILYHYNGVYWEKQINDSKLNHYIIFKMFDKLLKLVNNLNLELLKIQSTKDNKNSLDSTIDYINELLKNLRKIKDGNVKKKVLDEIKMHIVNNEIQFDEHPYLFSFNNKLFDLKQNKFIEPRADYYISQTTGYDYSDNYKSSKIKEVQKLLESIIPNQIIRDYWLTLVATCLTGINIQKFIVASGTGGNGKSLFHEFLLSMLGSYGTTLKNNILTKDIKDGATPEIAGLHNMRGVITSEPDSNFRIIGATLKPITGNKSMKARHLYGHEFQALMKLTFIMECNDIPKLDEVNEAIERRLIRINFPKSFITEDDYNNLDESEKINYGIKNSYYSTDDFRNEYKQALFNILSKYVDKYNDNLQMPEEVKKITKIYLNESDDLHEWINATYDFTDNIKDTIKLKSIYDVFKSSDYFNNLNKKQKREFNYKWFVNKLETNITIKKYIGVGTDNVNILRKYKIRQTEKEKEESPLDD